MKIIAIIKTVKLKNLSLHKIFRYKNFFKPLLILTIVLCIGLSFFFHFQSKVNAKEEDKVNTKVEELTKKEYDYELTKLLVKRKGKSELETVILDSDLENETVISSLEVGKQKVDLEENNQRKKILKKKLKELLQDKDIEYAQPSYLYTSEAWTREGDKDTPDDYDASIHWYYEKANLREMWKVQDCVNDGEKCGGSSDVTVAVVDTGLAFENHTSVWADVGSNPFVFSPATDLFVNGSVNLYTNSGEVENDGVDNDGNGFVDDYHGVNTENYVYCKRDGCNSAQKAETGHPNDDVGHGTYVTGLITSLVGNGTGSVSPAHNITIMPIKANYPKLPLFGTAELVTAIDYAVANGANIINLSLAGSGMDPLLKEAVDRAYQANVLVVVASGNSGGSVQYPAKYESVVAVGAVNVAGNRANYSSYGPELDLVAYVGNGGGIGDATYQISYKCFGRSGDLGCADSTKEGEHYNLDPNRYTEFEAKYGIGTSYAAPQVSALAAIIWGNNPDAKVGELRYLLLNSIKKRGTDKSRNEIGVGYIDFSKVYMVTYPNYTKLISDTLGKSNKKPSIVVFNDRIVQVVKGANSNNLFIRSTVDGNFDESEEKEQWILIDGQTSESPSLATFSIDGNERLYLSVMGKSGKIFTRSTIDGIKWTDWSNYNGKTILGPSMLSFEDRLYQVIRGQSTNNIYIRSTKDGQFDGLLNKQVDTEEEWSIIPGQTISQPKIILFNNKLYLFVIGKSGSLYQSYMINGEMWSTWIKVTNKQVDTFSVVAYDNKLFSYIRYTLDQSSYFRFSEDGENWSPNSILIESELLDFDITNLGSEDSLQGIVILPSKNMQNISFKHIP